MKTQTRYIMNGFLDVTEYVLEKRTIPWYCARFDTIRPVDVIVEIEPAAGIVCNENNAQMAGCVDDDSICGHRPCTGI